MNRRRDQIEEANALKATSPTAKPKDLQVKLVAKQVGGIIRWDSQNSQAGSPMFQPQPFPSYLDQIIRQHLYGFPSSVQYESESPSPLKLPRRHIDTPIVGYRSWKLTMESDGKATLRATGVTAAWKGTSVQAECLASDPFYAWTVVSKKKHRSPSPDCACGIYAYTHPKPIAATADQVHGAIVAWGRTVEHGTEGFRSANAQIIALALRPESMFANYHDYWKAYQLTQEGAKRLGIPVVAVEALELYAREFGEHLA